MPFVVRATTPCRSISTYCSPDNHKPASIDPTKPGTLEVNPGREVTTVRVERPTVNVRVLPTLPTTPWHMDTRPDGNFSLEQRGDSIQGRREAREGMGVCAHLRRAVADLHAREARLARQPQL